MLNISNELKAIYKNDTIPRVSQNVRKDLEIFFPSLNLTVRTDQIVEDTFELTEMLCAENDIVFGSCAASTIKFTLADVVAELKGQSFTINQLINGYTVPLGVYTVDSCIKQDELRYKDIVAYDALGKTDVDVSDWYNGLTFPTTLKAFGASLLSYLGIDEEIKTLPNDNMVVDKTIAPSKLKGRDVLFACEQLNGCFGHINRYGKFTHIVLDPIFGLYPSETLYPRDNLFPAGSDGGEILASYRSVRFEEYLVKPFDKLQIRQETDDIGAIVGTGSNKYVIEGNFLVYGKSASELQTIAQNAFGNIKNRAHRPYISENIGLPYVEVGDVVAFMQSDTVESYVLKRTLKGMQALTDNYEAKGNEERENDFSVNAEIEQLKGKYMLLNKGVEGVRAAVGDLEQGTETQLNLLSDAFELKVSNLKHDTETSFDLLSDAIELKVSKNGVVQAINLDGSGAKIDVTKLDIVGLVTIQNLNTPGSVVIDGGNIKANSLDVDSLKVGKLVGYEIEGSNIFGGSITSSAWNGQAWGTYYNEIEMQGGSLKCKRTFYSTQGSTSSITTTLDANALTINNVYANNIGTESKVTDYGYFNELYVGQLGSSSSYVSNGYVRNLRTHSIMLQANGTLGFFGNTATGRKSIAKLSNGTTLDNVISRFNTLLDILGHYSGGYGLVTIST